jgi:predicted XRE-type DNA-binding protein
MVTKKRSGIPSEKSSGNVFADLGLPNPEQALLKARLTLQIYRIIKARKLTQARAGNIVGIAQPRVSQLMRNRSGNFSVERLMTLLTALVLARSDAFSKNMRLCGDYASSPSSPFASLNRAPRCAII